jgi:nitrate/TMAO reductase-like tetraheme cytochrome c subunit
MTELTSEEINDLKVLASFIELFCHAKHDRKAVGERTMPDTLQNGKRSPKTVCVDCAEVLEHGMKKRLACPLAPKPTCKSCHVRCYTAGQRKIRNNGIFRQKNDNAGQTGLPLAFLYKG